MEFCGQLLQSLGIDPSDQPAVRKLSQDTGIPVSQLKYYDNNNILPASPDIELICRVVNISPVKLMLRMGKLDHRLLEIIQKNADSIYKMVKGDLDEQPLRSPCPPVVFETQLGRLYQGDCINLLQNLANNSVDLIFADPPFNLNKLYPSGINDKLKETQYLKWCEKWLEECVRVLSVGGSLFIWNLPKWNTSISGYLNNLLTFRHWISVDIKCNLPISARLYPSHYSLLYYCKGEKPKTFHPDRLPMQVCPSCKADLRDYGGYKDKMNPKGVNLTDVWYDMPPVRHAKYKRRNANELSLKLLDRVIEMASEEGDLVFDPFGGSGTTYVVAEIKKRRWIGIEIGPVDDIMSRFAKSEDEAKTMAAFRKNYNCLFTENTLRERCHRGLWTCETVRQNDRSRKYPIIRKVQLTVVDRS